MHILYFIISLIILIKAADYFVDAAINIAKIFKAPEIIVGATIVSIGTTLPEIMVSASGAMKGMSGIAFGNALGSIICNTALIASISLIFSPKSIKREDLKIPMIFFFVSFFIYMIFAYCFNRFYRITGIILICVFIIYIYFLSKSTSKKIIDDKEAIKIEKAASKEIRNFSSLLKHICILVISAILIAISSNILVDNGCFIARLLGVSETTIGITMIALGTSLPELTTCITSIIKKHSNLSLGNIIGANLFNIVLVTGVASSIMPFKIPSERTVLGINSSYIIDIPIALLVMAILCVPTYINSKTTRRQGFALLLIYFAFLIYNFV